MSADPRTGRLAADDSSARPVIVCLCGSTRFFNQFQLANYERTMTGEIVLSVGFYPHSIHHGEGVGHDSDAKRRLDELHLRKIDYARSHGKPVKFVHSNAQRRAALLTEGVPL